MKQWLHIHTFFVIYNEWQLKRELTSKNPLRFWGDDGGASMEYFQTLYTSAARAGIYNIADSLVSWGFRAQISSTQISFTFNLLMLMRTYASTSLIFSETPEIMGIFLA